MKRYGMIFALFGFVGTIVVALATEMDVNTAVLRGFAVGFGFGVLGAFMGKVVELQLEEMHVEETEMNALNAQAPVSTDEVYDRFRKLVMGDEAATSDGSPDESDATGSDGDAAVDSSAEAGDSGSGNAAAGGVGDGSEVADASTAAASVAAADRAPSRVDAVPSADEAAAQAKEFVARVREATAQGGEVSAPALEKQTT
ncbi:MAG: hypothetical protein AAF581_16785 [Planctomycetota bacterium]